MDTDPTSVCCVQLLQSCPALYNPVDYTACQAPLSKGFSRQEYRTGLPFSPSRGLLDPGIQPMCLTSPALAGGFFTTGATWDSYETYVLIRGGQD